MTTANERGIALLLTLVALVGVAGLGLLVDGSRAPTATGPDERPTVAGTGRVRSPGNALRERLRGLRAREALLAHATLYADLYGPTGAGPGHLSCPDNDVPVGTAAAIRAPGRVGPDPPCGTRPRVSGALPVHVTVGAMRSVLDGGAHDGPALAYELAADVVNNPIDRPVNARSTGQALARLDGSVAIDARHLVPPATHRVRVWVAERLSASRARPVDDGGPRWADCVDASCSALPWLLRDGALEGVPVHRHWFVRNGWTADVDVRVDRRCTSQTTATPSPACRWRVSRTPDARTVRLSPDDAS